MGRYAEAINGQRSAPNHLGPNLWVPVLRRDVVDFMSFGIEYTRKHITLENEGRRERARWAKRSHSSDDAFTPTFGHTPSTCPATVPFSLFRGRTSTRSVAAGGC